MSPRASVLHVDDDPALRRLVEEIFKDEADELVYVSAEDGPAALEALEDIDGPVLLLVDRRLPGTDLWELVDEIAENKDLVSVPTFVLSGSEDPEAIAEAYANGAVAYLQKPVDADGFYDIANLLERYIDLATFPVGRP